MAYDLTADQQLRLQAASMAAAYGTKHGNPDVIPIARAIYEFLVEQTNDSTSGSTSGKHERTRTTFDEILEGLGDVAKEFSRLWDQAPGGSGGRY